MYFCPNCDNAFDISKTSPKPVMMGGAENNSDTPTSVSSSAQDVDFGDIITKTLNNTITSTDVTNLNVNDLIKSDIFKQMPNKKKELVQNKLNDLVPVENKIKLNETQAGNKGKDVEVDDNSAYFVCSCGTYEPIKQGTLIMSRVNEGSSVALLDKDKYRNMIYNKALPHTRNYICPNSKCVSHKDHSKRNAVFFRTVSYSTAYACVACETIWSA
jgi:hypothetical protein